MDDLRVVAETVVKKLIENKISLSSAESMTGGMFAKSVTDVAGASNIFDRSLVTYSKRAKEDELGVSLLEIEKYGVVSEWVAIAMAKGLYKKTKSDVCVAITGVAGPGPDEGIAAGTFYIGLNIKEKSFAKKYELGEIGRDNVRKIATKCMFEIISEALF